MIVRNRLPIPMLDDLTHWGEHIDKHFNTCIKRVPHLPNDY